MRALTIENRVELRRWALSAAFVVAAHAAIGLAVLTWRVVNVPMNSTATVADNSLTIELAPLLPASSPAQGPPASSAAGERAQNPAVPSPVARSETIANAPTPEPIERVPESADTTAPPGVATVPTASQPSDGQNSAAAETGGGGGAAIPRSSMAARPEVTSPKGSATTITAPVDPGPLDMSITVVAPPHARKPAGLMVLKKFGLLHPANPAGEHSGLHRLNAARRAAANALAGRGQGHAQAGATAKGNSTAGAVRNAIGDVPAPGTAAGNHSADGVANAIGSRAGAGLGGGSTNPANRTAINAAGMTVQLPPGSVGAGKPSSIATQSTAMANPHSPVTLGTINGRTMFPAGMRPGVIGGPARTALPGVINGTDFRPRP